MRDTQYLNNLPPLSWKRRKKRNRPMVWSKRIKKWELIRDKRRFPQLYRDKNV
jgi:hypothetical protein